MREILTVAEVRALEAFAMGRGETGAKLMERAGRAVVEAIVDKWPELDKGEYRAAVLTGPGNNGGDGFVVARILKEGGWHVDVWMVGDETKLSADAAVNLRKFRWTRAEMKPLKPGAFGLTDYDMVVDAMFGAGLARPLTGVAADAAAMLSKPGVRRATVVAVDAPSGLCLDSGRVIGAHAVRADLTVSFEVPRPGLYLADGPAHAGDVAIASIGLPVSQWRQAREAGEGAPPALHLIDAVPLAPLRKSPEGHKHAHGHAVVLAGPPGSGGAARLGARAALRVGAGLVTVAAPAKAVAEHASRLDAVMVTALGKAGGIAGIAADPRVTALLIGPNHGGGAPTRAAVAEVLATDTPAVLDADALTAFEDDPAELWAMLRADVVLTPHLGEFRRLFPDLAAELSLAPIAGPAPSRVEIVRRAAERAGAVVLLKGADTVIADVAGAAAVHSAHRVSASAWLATAGSGDVLAGMVAGLMARGLGPRAAAESAAWLHVAAAREVGPGLIAEDLPGAIPAVFRGLGL